MAERKPWKARFNVKYEKNLLSSPEILGRLIVGLLDMVEDLSKKPVLSSKNLDKLLLFVYNNRPQKKRAKCIKGFVYQNQKLLVDFIKRHNVKKDVGVNDKVQTFYELGVNAGIALRNTKLGIQNWEHIIRRATLPPTYVEGFHDLEAVKAMEYRTLGKTGLRVSKLSFGGGPMGCHYGTYDEAEAIETIRRAIRQGINYIDTAPWYGQGRSETLIGKALKGIPRQAYYIATKVGRYELDFDNMFDFTVEKTRKSLKKSLELLQLDYVDVLQVHDIEFAPSLDVIVTQTLPEVSRQVRDGKARFIGITGYPISVLKECVERSNIAISCVLTYSRYTLIDETLVDYAQFFKKHNIGIINAAGPCMGLLTNNPPPAWHPAADEVKEKCTQAVQCCKDHDQNLARLAVWHSMQCPDVATNLVGMQNLKDLSANLDVLRKGISEKEKEVLRDLQEKYFSKVKGRHWEGHEIEAYRKAMNERI